MIKEANFYLEISKERPDAKEEFEKYMELFRTHKPFECDGKYFMVSSIEIENDKFIINGGMVGVVEK